MILIHPSTAQNTSAIAALQLATGMRAAVINRRAQLIEVQARTVYQTTDFDAVRQPRAHGERAKLTAIRIAEHLQEQQEGRA